MYVCVCVYNTLIDKATGPKAYWDITVFSINVKFLGYSLLDAKKIITDRKETFKLLNDYFLL